MELVSIQLLAHAYFDPQMICHESQPKRKVNRKMKLTEVFIPPHAMAPRTSSSLAMKSHSPSKGNFTSIPVFLSNEVPIFVCLLEFLVQLLETSTPRSSPNVNRWERWQTAFHLTLVEIELDQAHPDS
jgi:hypothetical protein